MADEDKTRDELSYEVAYLRLLLSDLENKHKQSEELLKVVTDQYRHITEAVSDYIFSVHVVEGKPVETVHGPGCKTVTGYSPQDFAENGYLWITMVYEEDRPLVLKHVTNILSGHHARPLEHRIVRKDGVVRWVRNMPVCQYDSQGKLVTYDGLIRDITERKIAEEALRWSETKYRIVADFTYDWEYWLSPEGDYIYMSPSCERISGYRPEEFMSNPGLMVDIVHPEDRDRVIRHFDEVLEGDGEFSHLDFRIVTKGGQVRWLSHNCQSIYGEHRTWLGRRASNRDITTRVKLIEELRSAERIEALGVLDLLNGMLSAVRESISKAKWHTHPEDEVVKHLERAEKASLRAIELTELVITQARHVDSIEVDE